MAKRTRNANGRSSIYQAADGWHGRVSMGVRDDGKPDRRHVRGKTRAEVTRKVRELEKARDSGNVTKPGEKWTVAEWMDHWLNNIVTATTSDNGWDAYFYAVKHIRRYVGAHKLSPQFRPEHLEAMYRKMQEEGASAATVHQVHRTIRTALNVAVAREKLAKNPALLAKPPKVEDREIEPFSREEISKLFNVALKKRNACRWIIAISLGLRQGEVLGLRWSDIDFEEGTLRVNIQRARPKWAHGCGDTCGRKHAGHCPQRVNLRAETKTPKSRAGKRPIGLPDPLLDQLKLHAAEQAAERERAGSLWHEGEWLFTDELGKPLNHRTDLKRWKELLAAAGVRDARLHDARHTAATVLLELGVTQRAAEHVMGWSNPSMTKRYMHVNGTVLGSVADKVGATLWPEPEEEKPLDSTEVILELSRHLPEHYQPVLRALFAAAENQPPEPGNNTN
ncbi:site-specific integrase [Saccharopolyspora hirsuta]|uniref:Site-specific integrase n=1 Tax=Saccharopolyspora hirsuta TaxID=1837 RepID=A0A5M7C6J9_SACHI|nr:site-specific integrase [Saccharopolyspora hirsuta]KAA5836057.1 site-specific integrase [Saccharopolyspora hirsuta]